MSQHELDRQRKEKFPKEILFSIPVPVYNTPKDYLTEMIESVLRQSYPRWELLLADGSDAEHAYVREICESYAQKDSRIRFLCTGSFAFDTVLILSPSFTTGSFRCSAGSASWQR